MIIPDLTRLSPNVNDALMPAGVKTVIIHCTRSGVSMNPTEFEGTLNYMSRPGTTSSQWVISRTGLAARVVPDNRQAWHAQEDNDNAWGIEVEQGVETDGFTPPQLSKLIEVCRGYMTDFGVPAEHAASSHSPGFIGHQETVQGRRNGKSDPGSLFPWEDFINTLRGDGDTLTEEDKRLLADREGRVVLDHLLVRHYNTRLSPDRDHLVIYNPESGEDVASIPVPSLP